MKIEEHFKNKNEDKRIITLLEWEFTWTTWSIAFQTQSIPTRALSQTKKQSKPKNGSDKARSECDPMFSFWPCLILIQLLNNNNNNGVTLLVASEAVAVVDNMNSSGGSSSGTMMMGFSNSSSYNRSPFTVSQWQELEHQALIFKYMVAGLPVPPDLVLPIQKSFDSISHTFFQHPSC